MTQNGWQPIDTAPTDVELLVFTRRWGSIIARRDKEHGEWLSRMQVPVSLADAEDTPTHWHPLPDPPADVEGQSTPGEGGDPVS